MKQPSGSAGPVRSRRQGWRGGRALFSARCILWLPLLLFWAGGAGAQPVTGPRIGPDRFLRFVESFPIETELDHPDLPEAHDVWKGMIDAAARSLDIAEFYASSEPGSRLEPVLSALETAAQRGCAIRFLAEKSFYKTYPETIDRLRSQPGITVRLYDVKSTMGGVLHAKYFIADGREAYLGSQNFDWRSLTHIQELGVWIREPAVARALGDVFEADWDLAGGTGGSRSAAPSPGPRFPVAIPAEGDSLRITPVFSPTGWLPDASLWDLPRLAALIDSARVSVRVQLLTYRSTGGGKFFETLEAALRRAGARGVAVQLLLSNWCKRPGIIDGLKSLEALPGIDVRLVTIPQWSGGFIPYARVIHAKYLVCDGDMAWIGTSNWEWDYFHASRNVGLILEGPRAAAVLNRFFLSGWEGPYALPVDPCSTYAAPRIGD